MVRVISGAVLGAVALALILFVPTGGLRVVALLVAVLAIREYLALAGLETTGVPAMLAFAMALGATWAMSVPAPRADLVLVGALMVLALDVLFRARPIAAAAAGVVGTLYVGVPLGTLVAVHGLGGRDAVLLALGTVVVSDSMQYYCGRAFGRRLLAPATSPKKTIEGAAGGLVFGTAVMLLGGRRVFPSVSAGALVAAGVAVVVAGICGDLFESRLKRDAGVKDSSSLIPGHGGVLDRIDALLFAAPVFYLFLHQWR